MSQGLEGHETNSRPLLSLVTSAEALREAVRKEAAIKIEGKGRKRFPNLS